jgi:pimeloyl-ACP methyl ester carboxylesterase
LKIFTLLALLLVGLIVVVQWRAGVRETAAEREFPPHGRLLDINGTRVHVVQLGEGPDLVLIHGASGHTREMTFGFAQELVDQGYRVTIPDRPALGWTQNTKPEYASVWSNRAETPFEQAALLRAAVAQLGVERPVLVGQSFGGAVAWAWALDAPDSVQGVVSIAGVANPWPGKLSTLHRINSTVAGAAIVVPVLTAFAPQSTIEDTLRSIFEPNAVPQGYLDHVGSGLTLRRKTMRGNARQITSLRPHIVEIANRYGEMRMPVEIVHGDADTIVPLTVHSITLPDQIKEANLTVIEGAGHMPHHTHRRDVIDAINRVVARAGLR